MSDDFGYFGKGTDGYIHYMQSFNEGNKGGGGKKPNSSGCLTLLIQVSVVLLVVAFIINAFI